MDLPTDYIEYQEGYGYWLRSGFQIKTEIKPDTPIIAEFFSLESDGVLRILPGYAWDGSTKVADTKSTQIASVVHDALCQMVQEYGLDKKWKLEINKLYYNLSRMGGMSRLRSAIRFLGIEIFPWERSRGKEVIKVYLWRD